MDIYADKIGIYKILQKSTGFAYVGQTGNSFKKRYWIHNWGLSTGVNRASLLQAAFNDTGTDDFIFMVVEVIEDKTTLNEREVFYISECMESGISLNVMRGGGPDRLKGRAPVSEKTRRAIAERNSVLLKGRKHSESTKESMKKSSKHLSPTPEHIESLRRYMSSRVVSDETKEKIRQLNLGSKNHFSKINEEIVYSIKIDLMNGLSIKDTCQKYGVTYNVVSFIANNRTWTHVEATGWDEFALRRKTK